VVGLMMYEEKERRGEERRRKWKRTRTDVNIT
jgi:hypothetical protein